ncbi:NapC/NirT family cytochrome c [Acidobacteriota bacterium]
MKLVGFFQRLIRLPRQAWRHWLGVMGIIFTTTFAVILVVVFLADFIGFHPGPYAGIIIYMIVPTGFVVSLIMIPLGGWFALRKDLKEEPGERRFPVIDLNKRGTLQALTTVIVLTIVNVFIIGTATYKGLHYMDTDQFCGKTCHTVMEPEYTAYSRSPHSRVNCVECHIGPGAPWFVKSKISGSWQVVSVMFNLYPRPVPAPIESLRPARETCEQCHWPAKFHGEQMRIRHRHEVDEENSEVTNVLMMNIGGISPLSEQYEGIHWHVSPQVRIKYYAADDKRMEIPYVLVEDDEGRHEEFLADEDFKLPEHAELRVMDCIDCHNRPTHIYEDPSWAIDEALQAGRIPPGLPYSKKVVLQAIKKEYSDKVKALNGIGEEIRNYYKENGDADAGLVDRAVEEAQAIYSNNIFPGMNITWGTYPNHIGHTLSAGCFRCHDEVHESKEGNVISQDCDQCHTLIAMEEEDPEILGELGIEK